MFQEEQKAHVKVLRKKEVGAIHGRAKRHCGWRGGGGEAGQVRRVHGVEPSHQSGESGYSSSMLWEGTGELRAAHSGLPREKQTLEGTTWKQREELRDHTCLEEQ